MGHCQTCLPWEGLPGPNTSSLLELCADWRHLHWEHWYRYPECCIPWQATVSFSSKNAHILTWKTYYNTNRIKVTWWTLKNLSWFLELLGLFHVRFLLPFLGLSLVSDNSYLLLAVIGNDVVVFTESKVGARNPGGWGGYSLIRT